MTSGVGKTIESRRGEERNSASEMVGGGCEAATRRTAAQVGEKRRRDPLVVYCEPCQRRKKGRIEVGIGRKADGAVMQCCSVPGWQARVGEIAGLGEGVGDRHWSMGETRQRRGGGGQPRGLVCFALGGLEVCLQPTAA